jgi:hypothetical protein
MPDYSIPAPVGGWNAIEALDMMQPTDAIRLVNLIPRETSVESRKGTDSIIASGYESFESLHTYNGSGGNELIAIGTPDASTWTFFYDIDVVAKTATSIGNIITGSVDGQLRWQSLNINDKIVFVCDAAFAPYQWDGTTFGAVTISGTGLTATDLSGVTSYKGRAVYWSEGANSFWYGAAGAYAGAMTEFPIDFVTQRGGGIREIVTWTRDSGDGMDDWFVILMDTGETLVYTGDDPSSNFTLQGVFQLGEPLSIRGSCNLASDRIIVTRDGYINLSSALQQGRIAAIGNVGDKIVNAVKELTELYADNYGWEINFFPSKSLLIVNVPIDTTTPSPTYKQHVMNTKTGSWCEFTGWNAATFEEFNNDVYYCTSEGSIYKAFDGTSDDGAFIDVECIPAFSNFGIATLKKQLTVCNVVSNFYIPQYLQVDALADFTISTKKPLNYPSESTGELWDVPDWDDPDWDDGESGTGLVQPYPIHVGNYGYSLTVRVRHATIKQVVKYYSFKLKFKAGRSI